MCFSAGRSHPTPPGCGARQLAHHSTSHLGEQGFISRVQIHVSTLFCAGKCQPWSHGPRWKNLCLTCEEQWSHGVILLFFYILDFLICFTSQDVVSLLLAAGCPESAPGGTLPRRRGSGEMRHRGGKEVSCFVCLIKIFKDAFVFGERPLNHSFPFQVASSVL